MLDRALNIAQLIAIVTGVIWIGREIGAKETTLAALSSETRELSSIVRDLTRTQIELSANHNLNSRLLEELTKRFDRLDSR